MSRMVCPNCNYQTTRDEQFCSKCGTRMKPVMKNAYCRHCGRALNLGDQFCGQCGTPVTSQFWKILFIILGLIIGIAASIALNSYLAKTILSRFGSAA